MQPHQTLDARASGASATPPPPRRSRRDALRLMGAAAAGGAATGLVATGQAAADNGLSITINTTSTENLTRVDYTGDTAGAAFLFQAGTLNAGADAANPAALAGWSSVEVAPSGVSGHTNQSTGYGVVGVNNSFAPGTVGVYGLSYGGIGGHFAGGQIGVTSNGPVAAQFTGVETGVHASGARAAMYLIPQGDRPVTQARHSEMGMVTVDSSGELWCCVGGGNPGVWRKLASLNTAGALHAITPFRAYDSRSPLPSPGVLATGSSRTISVADRRAANGTVNAPNLVPPGATAVTLNLTITGTKGNGFLSLNPGSAGSTLTSSINWSSANLSLANGLTMMIGAGREITVSCGGPAGASTHVIVDITGYYL